jgi:probable H4MPT-linked C1 transfer pathway protein
MLHLGWDVGGVHLKVSALETGAGGPRLRSVVRPFALWRDPGGLTERLRLLRAEASGGAPITAHAVTMTGELADVFPRRRDGVRAILAACAGALPPGPLRVFDLEGAFVAPEAAMERPSSVAAANWLAAAAVAARRAPHALFLDVGSTTTDIVPLRDGRPRPAGRTDTDRLLAGELVYTGCLRTPPAALAEAVPLRGGWCRVAPEYFTCTGDVYRVLGRITEEEYTVPTPDGRGTGRAEAAARLARLVCSDPEDLDEAALGAIAAYLEERQIEQIAAAIRQVLSAPSAEGIREAVVAGAGAFLAEAAARRAGLRTRRLARLLPEVAGESWDVAAPSAALALLLAERADVDPPAGPR